MLPQAIGFRYVANRAAARPCRDEKRMLQAASLRRAGIFPSALLFCAGDAPASEVRIACFCFRSVLGERAHNLAGWARSFC